jgi:hypothetical protein
MGEDQAELTRTCLHCVLQRVLRAESDDLMRAGLELTLSHSQASWVPQPGRRVYRRLRRLLQQSMTEAVSGTPLKIAIVDQVGKSYVEVTAIFCTAEGWKTISCPLPRYDLSRLWGGFAESI